MKTLIFCISLLLFSATCGLWAAPKPGVVELKGGETPEQIQDAYAQAVASLLPAITKDDGLRKIESLIHHAARPGAEPERIACCKAVGAVLDSDTSPEAKAWLIKLVTFAGREEIIPALAKLLDGEDQQLRELARCALQHNPTPAAGEAIRKTLLRHWREKKDPEWQAALVLALGSRKESANLEAIFTLTSNKDSKIQEAALVALGMTATVHPVHGQPGIWNSMPEGLRDRAAEAFMKSAELLVKQGKASEAAKLYTEIYQSKLSRPVRMAGLVGLLMSTGDDAAGKILEILAGADKDARAIAAGIIPDLPSGPLTALAKGMVKLPSESQILVLGTLAERGEKAAKPIALEFAMSKEENVQVAGLTALGRLGDESTVDVLVNHLQAGGAVSAAAKSSLARITGPGVEDRIISALRSQSEATRRATLIEVIENRGATRAVPLLLEESLKDTPTIRRPAMRALGKLAAPGNVPAMVKALLKASPGSEREEAEKAIASVCARTPEKAKQAESVLALYNAAPPAERLAILPVLGRLGGKQVFDAIKTALASNDPETYQVAVDAISNWPDSDETVERELLTLAQKAEKKSDRTAAMRAYIRVISMPSGIPDKAKLAKFQKALDSAEGDQEKMFVLERLADIKRIETLRIVLPYIDKPALAERACVTTLDLARDRGLRNQNKAEFEEALKKVIATSKEKATIERANRYLQEQRQ